MVATFGPNPDTSVEANQAMRLGISPPLWGSVPGTPTRGSSPPPLGGVFPAFSTANQYVCPEISSPRMGRSVSFERCLHCETPNTETERAPKRPPRRASALAAAFESSRRRINEVAKRGRVCAVRRRKNRVSPPFLRPSSTWRTNLLQ